MIAFFRPLASCGIEFPGFEALKLRPNPELPGKHPLKTRYWKPEPGEVRRSGRAGTCLPAQNSLLETLVSYYLEIQVAHADGASHDFYAGVPARLSSPGPSQS